jgi:D-alanine-D-alanine ligase
VADSGVYDYAARYTAGITEFFAPARLTADETQAVERLAVQAHTTLGLSFISRTDLILDADGTPWFLEVNVAPGLTETSLLPLAAGAADLDLGVLYRELVQAVIAD